MITFYGYFRSSAAYRCRIALSLKDISYKFVPVHLRRNGGEQKQPNYLAINPQGLVPVLDVDGTILTQSLAIIEYLDDAYPTPRLLPGDALKRAQARAFAEIIACDIHPLQNLRVLQYLKQELQQTQNEADKWCQNWIHKGLSSCEALISAQDQKYDFAFGNAPGLADICLIPQLYAAERFGVELSSMHNLLRIRKNCNEIAAFQNAHPDNQPDYEA